MRETGAFAAEIALAREKMLHEAELEREQMRLDPHPAASQRSLSRKRERRKKGGPELSAARPGGELDK